MRHARGILQREGWRARVEFPHAAVPLAIHVEGDALVPAGGKGGAAVASGPFRTLPAGDYRGNKWERESILTAVERQADQRKGGVYTCG